MTVGPSTERLPAKVPLVSRIYVWSIVFESLLFFILGSQFTTGFNITVGKLLQFCVIALLLLTRIAYGRDIKLVNPTSPAYKYFAAFFALAVVSGIVGALSGSYRLNAVYGSEFASNIFARFIRGSATRPFIEYAILSYYFVYFTVLPRYLLRSDEEQAYFFRVFRVGFIACLAAGFADLLLQRVGYVGLPRDMSEGRTVGWRFHGFAGEPRDAFVYLMFCLALLNLQGYWRKQGTVSRPWLAVIVLAALLTQSASGLLGLLFAATLVIGASVRDFSVRHVIWLGGTLLVIIAVVIIGVNSSPRLQTYLTAGSLLFGALQDGIAPPAVIAPQMVNIYPLWDLYTKISHGTLTPLFIGSGLGSASVTNNNLGGSLNELANPNSEVIRLLYECGIVGTFLLVVAFIYPVKIVTSSLSPKVRRRFLIFTCLLIGLFLAHRSTTPFIYLGVFMAVMRPPQPDGMSARIHSRRRTDG